MNIIPVIDYQQGNVVLAQMGNRDNYQSISSVLCDKPDICSVIEGILTLAEFKTIYIADLDCIEKQQLDNNLWPSLCSKYPNIEFWIDLGRVSELWGQVMHNTCNARPVIGSESYTHIDELNTNLDFLNQYNPLLSIDIKNNEILGPASLLQKFNAWPNEIIILSLSHVGSNNGPNFAYIQTISQELNNQNIFYGGGTRDINDIKQLEQLNIQGILVANSLHSGKFDKKLLKKII
ncbi:MAG: HisA/HisF-related TIM barrel protein [Gammaproteobacteria bacterium]|nr:HisA/HisF-related TIM barrel protein [Gammaproteobacteria bacterium]